MSSAAKRGWVIGVGVLAVAVAAAGVAGRLLQYTDGRTIRQPLASAVLRDVLWQPPRPLAPAVNSAGDDYEPHLSRDGAELYFVRGRPGHNAELYQAAGRADHWAAARSLHELNSDDDDLGPQLTADGQTLYFYSNRPGGLGGYDLWMARRGADGWLPPLNLGPAVNTPYHEYGPALAPDGTRLYFASNRPRSEPPADPRPDPWSATIRRDRQDHDYDLFVADVHDGQLQAARPLAVLNTPADEGAPEVSPAGDFLYFASDRPGGVGGFDLYRTRLLDGACIHVENLGVPVNSAANELDAALYLGGFGLLFSSDRAGVLGTVAPATQYDVYQSASREVFREVGALSLAAFWGHARKVLWWLLLTLLLLALLVFLLRQAVYGKLSLVVRCLLASIIVHLVLLLLLSFWEVGSALADAWRRQGGTQVALQTTAAVQDLADQIRGSLTDAALPAAALAGAPQQVWSPTAPAMSPVDVPIAQEAVDVRAPLSSVAVEWRRPDAAPPEVLPPIDDTPAEPHVDWEVHVPEVRPAAQPEPIVQALTEPAAPTVRPRAPEWISRGPEMPALHAVIPPALTAALPDARLPLSGALPTDRLVAAAADFPEVPHESAAERPALSFGLPLAEPLDLEMREQPSGAVAESAQALPAPAAVMRGPEMLPVAVQAKQLAALRSVDPPSAAPNSLQPSSLAGPVVAAPSSGLPRPVLPELLDDLPPEVLDDRVPAVVADRWPGSAYGYRARDRRARLVEDRGGTAQTELAVAQALRWLAAHQSPDGHWDGSGYDDGCGQCAGTTDYEVDIALTGLAVLCFLAADHTHISDGPFRDTVAGGVRWLMAGQRPTGDLRGTETMYSHGIAAIALAEAYGMTADPLLEDAVRRAVAFIHAARNRSEGGWRYDPGQRGDTSVLGWQTMAVKSAERAGIELPEGLYGAAGRWLDRVSTPSQPGRYAYQPGRDATPAMTAEGMFVQQLLGRTPQEPRMQMSAEFLMQHLPDWESQPNTYYWYYATLALYQHQGSQWQRWNQALTRQLLDRQERGGPREGSWPAIGKWAPYGGRVYQTALCTLMLEVYYRYLPTYMREVGSTEVGRIRP